LSAIPEVKIKNPSGYRPITGELPNPADPPKGCRLCGRCPYEFERCRENSPELEEVEPGHLVACFLHPGKEASPNG